MKGKAVPDLISAIEHYRPSEKKNPLRYITYITSELSTILLDARPICVADRTPLSYD